MARNIRNIGATFPFSIGFCAETKWGGGKVRLWRRYTLLFKHLQMIILMLNQQRLHRKRNEMKERKMMLLSNIPIQANDGVPVTVSQCQGQALIVYLILVHMRL